MHTDPWADSAALPVEDRKLIAQAVEMVRRRTMPTAAISPYAHEPEAQHWLDVDLASPDRFARSVWAVNLVGLAAPGMAHFLPALLAACFLHRGGWFQRSVLDFLMTTEEPWASVLDDEERAMSLRLMDRLLTFAWTNDRTLHATYPAFAVAVYYHAEYLHEVLSELRSRVASG